MMNTMARWGTCSALLLVFAAMCIGSATAAPPSPQGRFSCFSMHCGVPHQGAFPHFVVGHVVAIAAAGQAGALFAGMRKRGHWGNLPDGKKTFWNHLQPVAIRTGSGAVFVTLTSRAEMRAVPIQPGDFVRYSPHRGKYEVPPSDPVAAAYWAVDGCVAVLCDPGNGTCIERYVSGVYRVSDGRQLESETLALLPHGVVIDTGTMLPKHVENSAN